MVFSQSPLIQPQLGVGPIDLPFPIRVCPRASVALLSSSPSTSPTRTRATVTARTEQISFAPAGAWRKLGGGPRTPAMNCWAIVNRPYGTRIWSFFLNPCNPRNQWWFTLPARSMSVPLHESLVRSSDQARDFAPFASLLFNPGGNRCHRWSCRVLGSI